MPPNCRRISLFAASLEAAIFSSVEDVLARDVAGSVHIPQLLRRVPVRCVARNRVSLHIPQLLSLLAASMEASTSLRCCRVSFASRRSKPPFP